MKGGGGKMSVGLLGKLKKKKMAAQAHLAIDNTLGYKTSDTDESSGGTEQEQEAKGGSAWGALKVNLRHAQGKQDMGDVAIAAATAAGINLSDMKKQLQEHLADKEKNVSVARGYELATSTVSVALGLVTKNHRFQPDCLRSDWLAMVGARGIDWPRDTPRSSGRAHAH